MPISIAAAGAVKNIQIGSSTLDHRTLAMTAAEAGITQGEVLRLLLGLMNTRVEAARYAGEVASSPHLSRIEQFVMLIARDAGVIDQEQFVRLEYLAQNERDSDFKRRIQAIGAVTEEAEAARTRKPIIARAREQPDWLEDDEKGDVAEWTATDDGN